MHESTKGDAINRLHFSSHTFFTWVNGPSKVVDNRVGNAAEDATEDERHLEPRKWRRSVYSRRKKEKCQGRR